MVNEYTNTQRREETMPCVECVCVHPVCVQVCTMRLRVSLLHYLTDGNLIPLQILISLLFIHHIVASTIISLSFPLY